MCHESPWGGRERERERERINESPLARLIGIPVEQTLWPGGGKDIGMLSSQTERLGDIKINTTLVSKTFCD